MLTSLQPLGQDLQLTYLFLLSIGEVLRAQAAPSGQTNNNCRLPYLLQHCCPFILPLGGPLGCPFLFASIVWLLWFYKMPVGWVTRLPTLASVFPDWSFLDSSWMSTDKMTADPGAEIFCQFTWKIQSDVCLCHYNNGVVVNLLYNLLLHLLAVSPLTQIQFPFADFADSRIPLLEMHIMLNILSNLLQPHIISRVKLTSLLTF